MEIRFVEPAEVEQLRRNVQTAFPSKTPQALLDNMPEELVRPEEGRYLGCFDDDGTMIGSLLMMDFEMNVRGKMMKMGAPAKVAPARRVMPFRGLRPHGEKQRKRKDRHHNSRQAQPSVFPFAQSPPP